MNLHAAHLPYADTGSFSKLVNDYLKGETFLRPFYAHPPTPEGLQQAMEARRHFPDNRALLVEVLRRQYSGYTLTAAQEANLQALLQPNTFTITTAHQPNIFTGPLYFIYKILHAIKLADEWNKKDNSHHFVPVFYMGSEDADLDELGHFFIDNEKLEWATTQQGAVGRMNTKGLELLTNRLEGQFAHLPYGRQMVELCRKAYSEHGTVQEATHYLVNALFDRFGLLVLIPDDAQLKTIFHDVVRRELLEGFSQPLMEESIAVLSQQYKIQAGGRPINLFYLNEEGRRERIEKDGSNWVVKELGLQFDEATILQELEKHPERFSANVVLRGLFQEMVLPNIAFIGGGGEVAYWLELKKIFDAMQVPYPVILLRNSFMLVSPELSRLIRKLNLTHQQLFQPTIELLDLLAARKFGGALDLGAFEKRLFILYDELQALAAQTDTTLQPHVAALHTQSIQHLHGLEKKLKRASRRRNEDESRQLQKVKDKLFPGGGLQERKDNIMPLLAAYGPAIIDLLYQHSLALESMFTILELPES